jgi:antirestriction protein
MKGSIMATNNSYRIYVACLAAYNAGRLHGAWFDLEDYNDADELHEAIAERVLRTSPCPNVMVDIDCPTCEGSGSLNNESYGTTCPDCQGKGTKSVPSSEEYAVHDYDSEVFKDFGEYPNYAALFELMEMTEKHGDAWAAFVNRFGSDVTEANFEDAYMGEYESGAAFVEERALECGDIKEDSPFFYYIDWERAWDGDWSHSFTFENGYIFRSDW